jgi:hypothetical protein
VNPVCLPFRAGFGGFTNPGLKAGAMVFSHFVANSDKLLYTIMSRGFAAVSRSPWANLNQRGKIEDSPRASKLPIFP